MTYSIVARAASETSTPEWGVAVASKFLAVGSFVPWAEAGAGALATQALANLTFTSKGGKLLGGRRSAPEVVRTLIGADPEREHRQLGVVDSQGGAATFTGAECVDWAGDRTGEGYCCQGNILTGPEVLADAAGAFESTPGELAVRLLAALSAGDAAGGDRRGRQSAALVVVRTGGGYLGLSDRAVDLRVDDHRDPVAELRRLFDVHQFHFPRPETLQFVDIDHALASELRTRLAVGGEGPGVYDATLKAALFDFVGTENLEQRWSDEAKVERAVLAHLRAHTQCPPGNVGRANDT
jgi:uncharacterized Ntn-hydrolase superfamily protein